MYTVYSIRNDYMHLVQGTSCLYTKAKGMQGRWLSCTSPVAKPVRKLLSIASFGIRLRTRRYGAACLNVYYSSFALLLLDTSSFKMARTADRFFFFRNCAFIHLVRQRQLFSFDGSVFCDAIRPKQRTIPLSIHGVFSWQEFGNR